MNKTDVLALLKKEKTEFTLTEHPPVFTMEEMRQLHLEHEEDVAVNLFLRDDKKRNYYLVSADGKTRTDLKALRHILGSRPLSFASENDLKRILGLEKGNVCTFGILNDRDHRCEAVIDIRFQNRLIGIHPMENTATVFLKGSDLFALILKHGCRVRWADLNQIV